MHWLSTRNAVYRRSGKNLKNRLKRLRLSWYAFRWVIRDIGLGTRSWDRDMTQVRAPVRLAFEAPF